MVIRDDDSPVWTLRWFAMTTRRSALGRWSHRAALAIAGMYAGVVVLSFAPVELSLGGLGHWLAAPFTGISTQDLPVIVIVTLLLAVTVVVRALATRSSADVVLAAFSTPALLVGSYGLVLSYTESGWGVTWINLLSLLAGTVLALVVLADALLATRLDSRQRPLDS